MINPPREPGCPPPAGFGITLWQSIQQMRCTVHTDQEISVIHRLHGGPESEGRVSDRFFTEGDLESLEFVIPENLQLDCVTGSVIPDPSDEVV